VTQSNQNPTLNEPDYIAKIVNMDRAQGPML
jgi:hypothetical protein